MMRILSYILAMLVMAGGAGAVNDGGTDSPFSFGAGARELALGGAALSLSDPATAPFWNPSSLINAERLSVSGFHTRLYDSDVSYQYLGLALPTLDWGSFGAGIFRLGIDGIERRDENNLFLGTFEDKRLALYLAYARRQTGFDIGFSFMIENHSIADYGTTSSPGMNLSISRSFPVGNDIVKEISIAVNGRNALKPTTDLAGQSTDYPYAIDAGLAVKTTPFGKWNHGLVFMARATKTDFVETRFSAGLEYGINDMFYLRGGVRDNNFSVGGGLSYKMFTFDYAMVDRDLGSLHLFSITTSFGKSVSEKLSIRAEKREASFNSMMADRLTRQNKEMINDLVSKGREYRRNDRLDEAVQMFDKALFLARTNGADTTEIYSALEEASEKLLLRNNEVQFAQYLDSAKIKMNEKEYLAAKYFADQALAINSNSQEAKKLMNRASLAFDNIASSEEIITDQLAEIDSLLAYGQIRKAKGVMVSLRQFAPNDKRIKLTDRKVSFEYWREAASQAFNGENYEMASTAVDSALIYFPGHKWCLEMQSRIKGAARSAKIETHEIEAPTRKALSPEVLRQVETAYKTARELFETGDLHQAIAYWETVENLAPDFQSVREYLIKAYKFIGVELYGQNRLAEAVTTWEKAVKLNPKNDEINDYIKRTRNEIRKLSELTYEE